MRRANALVAQFAEQPFGGDDGTRPLRGRQEVAAAGMRLLDSATREVRQYDVPAPVGRPDVGDGLRARPSRGIRHRIVTDDSATRPVHRWGVEQRSLPRVPFRMLIADSHAALVGRAPEEALLIGPSLLLDVLVDGFESTWSLATPVDRPSLQPVAQPTVSEEDRRLLVVMAAGATDQAISRQLHISVRTVQRRVRALMDRLEAGTRFQAGMNAAKRGWI
ncbi:helix-turn-helix domain-containing protein [Pseudonocardia humida]|uniref:Response regulator transcription factor n=1 Tax=Pseudonocardia humida TaxID=2800819 RepID=A0ABT0ZS09_9PSEU|nr:LuxR C-terminal-related transcriptional regulator [Pseudonocardia humida]MCO1653498.1 response regulator transcription factor [Pseudonocardia humida]